MPQDHEGRWFPPICKRQAELLAESEHDILDVEGPRKSVKTVGCCHRLCRHLWECPNAKASMVGRTLTDNYDEGTWQLMTNDILPQWIDGGFGMEWVTKPKMSTLTHKMFCEVRNSHGGVSKLQLDSLRMEKEVERVFKGRMYSAIYMTEASNFKKRSSFDIMLQCLRGFGSEWKGHFLFLVDTNPAEEGESHWIFQMFHVFLKMTEAEIQREFPKNPPAMLALRKRMAMYRFQVSDNIWLTDEERAALEAEFSFDPDTYDRHWRGLWKKSAADTLFAKVWRPEFHIKGNPKTMADPDPEILMPEEDCTELITGWDVGDIHNAIVIMEKVMLGKENEEAPTFKILDELVLIDTPIRLEDLTIEFLELMSFWEQQIPRKINWIHWADSSALTGFNNISGSNEAKEIFRASNGRIELVGVTKGSVLKRIQLVRRLLHARRIYVSARCEQLIQTMTMIRPNAQGTLKRSGEPLRHAFDAMSYAVSMEAWSELQLDIENRLATAASQTAMIFHT